MHSHSRHWHCQEKIKISRQNAPNCWHSISLPFTHTHMWRILDHRSHSFTVIHRIFHRINTLFTYQRYIFLLEIVEYSVGLLISCSNSSKVWFDASAMLKLSLAPSKSSLTLANSIILQSLSSETPNFSHPILPFPHSIPPSLHHFLSADWARVYGPRWQWDSLSMVSPSMVAIAGNAHTPQTDSDIFRIYLVLASRL